jgi:hypothetical protein
MNARPVGQTIREGEITMNPNAMSRSTAVLSLIAGAAGLGACWSAKIDLTGDDGGAAISSSGSSGAGGSSGATAPPAACYADAGLVDGAEYSGIEPSWCEDAPAALVAFASPADLTAAIAGTWFDCDNNNFFSVLTTPVVDGVEITSDGHIDSLNVDGETKLANQSDFTAYFGSSSQSGYDPESKNVPFAMASYVIVDASATLGAGTYQMRITGADGSIEQAQILVYSGPDRIKLVLDNQSVTLVRAVSFRYRAGICSPGFAGGRPVTAGAFPLAGLAPGRWIWCGGEGEPTFGYGFDEQDDGTAVELDVDSTGNLVPIALPRGKLAPDVVISDAGVAVTLPYGLQGSTASVGTCPAALGILNSQTNYGPGGFYQPIPPQ